MYLEAISDTCTNRAQTFPYDFVPLSLFFVNFYNSTYYVLIEDFSPHALEIYTEINFCEFVWKDVNGKNEYYLFEQLRTWIGWMLTKRKRDRERDMQWEVT